MTLGEIEKEENAKTLITEDQLMEELSPIDARFAAYYRKLQSSSNLKDFLLWYRYVRNYEPIVKQVVHTTGVL